MQSYQAKMPAATDIPMEIGARTFVDVSTAVIITVCVSSQVNVASAIIALNFFGFVEIIQKIAL